MWATGSCSSSPVVMYKQLRKQNKSAVFFKTTAAHAHLCDTQPSPPKCERVTAFCVVVFLLSRSLFFGYYSCSCWLSIFLIFSALKMPCSPPSGQKTTMHCTLTKQLFGHFFCLVFFFLFSRETHKRSRNQLHMENFKSSLVNYLRENSNSKLVHLFFLFFFLNGPGQTKSCPALLFVKNKEFPRLSVFCLFFFFSKMVTKDLAENRILL